GVGACDWPPQSQIRRTQVDYYRFNPAGYGIDFIGHHPLDCDTWLLTRSIAGRVGQTNQPAVICGHDSRWQPDRLAGDWLASVGFDSGNHRGWYPRTEYQQPNHQTGS